MPEIHYAICKECAWEGKPTLDPHEARKEGYAHKKEEFHSFSVNNEFWDSFVKVNQ